MDKYLKEADIVDAVNNIGRMNIYEIVDSILEGTEEYKKKIMSLLNDEQRQEVEKLLEGGIL